MKMSQLLFFYPWNAAISAEISRKKTKQKNIKSVQSNIKSMDFLFLQIQKCLSSSEITQMRTEIKVS